MSKGLTSPPRLLYFRPVFSDDRRTFQRLKLSKPILASIDGMNALVLDIGLTGALLEHYGKPSPGDKFGLTFRWQGEDVEFVAEVVRTQVMREPGGDGKSIVSHTGVRFLETVGTSREHLQDLIATFVGRVLAAQKANAAGDRAAGPNILEQIGAARRQRSRGFVSYRLKGDSWWRIPTASSVQPADGFTVAAHEDEEEVEALCRTYAEADDEGRALIRLVAELSAADPNA